MSQETLTPAPLNPDTRQQHEVVHGQVVEVATDNDHGFMENALRSQNGETTHESRTPRHKKREIVESIAPENIYLYGRTATLAQMQTARELIHSQEFSAHTAEEKEYLIENILDRMLIEDDPLHESYDSKRHNLRNMLLESDKKFQKTARRKELDQARRDQVKLKRVYKTDEEVREKTPFVTKLKALMGSEQEEGDDSSETVYTASQLRRQIKKLDKTFNGLLGEVADTGTTPGYLGLKYGEFAERVEAAGENVNDKTRRSVERETLRKLIDMDRLAARKGVEDDERNDYENEIVDIFHRYTQLSDEEREVFGGSLGQRQQDALELSRLERQTVISHAEKNDKTPVTSRLRSALGATASKLIGASKHRWEARKTPHDKNDTEQLALFDEKPYKARHRRSKLDSLMDAPYAGYANLREHVVKRRKLHHEKLAAMSEDERISYEKKHQRINKAFGIGAVAVAVVGAAVLAKYGYDHMFDGDRTFESGDRSSGGLRDLLGIPELETSEPQGIEPGTHFEPNGFDGGHDQLTRSELFDGIGGSRRLSGANIESLDKFLDSYTVRDSDNRGVWGISEKYLESQGVKNPSVFETDAVKDYILQHSSLTNSSIIYPGDTIKLK